MSSRAIEVAIQKLAGVHKTDDLVCMVCTVQSVNEDAATCDCMGENDIIIPNVKLQAGVCDGLLILPVAGSTVIIAMSKYNEPFVFMISDVDKFYLQAGKASVTITNDGNQVYNDDKYGGIIKSVDPDNSDGGLLQRLNKIEKDVNSLKTALKTVLSTTVSEPGNGSASAFQAAMAGALANWDSQQLVTTQKSHIESDYIKHGKPNR